MALDGTEARVAPSTPLSTEHPAPSASPIRIGVSACLIGERVRLVPSGRYRALDRDLTAGDVTRPVTLAYATAELGIHWSF